MKKYSKYHLPTLLFMLAAGLASVSCADDDIAKDQTNDGQNGVSFSVTDVQDALDADLPSRATDAKTYLTHSIDFNEAGTADMCLQESTVPGVNPMKRTPQTRAWLKASIDANFGAFACKNGSAGPDYFYNEQVTPSGQMLQPKRWDASASTLKFYAVYPYMDGSNASQKLIQPTTGSLPYVAFEASTDIANQTDLMTAETAPINHTSTGSAPHVVPLKFYHALTAIRFGIGSNLSWNKTIKSIEFQGIRNAGRFDLATKTWSNQSGAQNFKLDNVNKSTSEVQNTVIVKDGNTFLMVPQTLPSGAKIVITFTDNSQITANIGGKTWAPGTTKTYMMTEKNSNWEYKLETTDPAVIAYDQTTSTTPYTIKSYRKDPATNTFQPVKWKVVSYQESADGGLTWGAETQTKPTWLTNLTTENGDGGTAAESGTVTVTKDVTDLLAARNNALKSATALGSAGSPYDLSTKGGSTARNTANSYLISAPGHYRIPLVYGNAIKNGATNSSSYISSAPPTMYFSVDMILHNFKDHNGNDITNPWIEKSNAANAGIDDAKIVWADEKDLVHLSASPIKQDGGNAYLDFEVKAADIKSGNAVVAVTKGGTVVWSWHLWFAPKSALTPIPVTNYQNKVYNFTTETLGWKPTKWECTLYNTPRTVKVRVEQTIANNGTKQVSDVTITQNPGIKRTGIATHYQFGRKDAFPGMNETQLPQGAINKNAGDNMSITNGIQNPENFYTLGYSWSTYPPAGYSYYNLWSADNTTLGWNDNAVVKTVYDPCPVGFKMPASNAFTGFTSNGLYKSGAANINANGTASWDKFSAAYGHNFWTNSSKNATIFFPASGFRSSNDGSLNYVGHYGYYWSAVPYYTGRGCFLYFDWGFVDPLHSGSRSFGLTARPVSE